MRRTFLQAMGVARGPRGSGPLPPQSKCYFKFLGWILVEICLKCIILVTNFQKSPSAGGSSPPAPLNLRFDMMWPEVTWCGQVLFFKADYNKIERQTNQLWRHFSDVMTIMSPKNVIKSKNTTKFFHLKNEAKWPIFLPIFYY